MGLYRRIEAAHDRWIARGGLFSPSAVRVSTVLFWLWLVSGLGYVLWQVLR